MKIDTNIIKQLREETGLGVMDCKKALDEAAGDINKAKALLKHRGLEIVAKKSGRTANDGIIASYIHTGGKIGVLVEVNCETDFVARNELFQGFAKNICLQVVASNPSCVKIEEISETALAEAKAIWEKELKDKTGGVRQKALEGKLAEFYRTHVLLNQAFIREPEKTIQDYLNEITARIGEKIAIRRFIRWELGA
ncbi:MAG: translation elongation factor Ts [Candidatus Omnitrophica bacterium]|nr:translation elongation factor Ts [Candidatus Omnitrophota bacterium]